MSKRTEEYRARLKARLERVEEDVAYDDARREARKVMDASPFLQALYEFDKQYVDQYQQRHSVHVRHYPDAA